MKPKNLPPSPPKLPIIGNLHQLGSLPHRSLKVFADKYGSIIMIYLGSKPTLIVSSSEAAEIVLKTHDLDFANRPKSKFTGRLMYNFIDVGFSPYGEYWRNLRSICVLQLLSNKRVQSFGSVREEEIALMVEKIAQSSMSYSSFNISDIFATLTNNIISRIAIGRRYSEEQSGSNFKKIYEEFLELLGSFNIGDYVPRLEWINHINGLEAKVNRVSKELDEYFENIVEQGMKRHEKIMRSYGESEKQVKVQQNFLDLLIELQMVNDNGFTLQRDTIKALIMNMFTAGTDTTSALLEWTITELVKNKKVMTKLNKEVRRYSDGKLHCITENDLEKLPYLKAVIQEALRMHPPAPLLLPRESRNPVRIMGYDIPSGTQVFINAFALGRDSSVWESPNEFMPERFLNTSIHVNGKSFASIPFGYGRRSCPGSTLALSTAQVAVANLVLRFDFTLGDGERLKDLDMNEAPGVVARRKTPLILEATLPNY